MGARQVKVTGKTRMVAAFAGAIMSVGAMSGFALIPTPDDSSSVVPPRTAHSMLQDSFGSSTTLVSLDMDWEPGDTVGAKAEAPPEPEVEEDTDGDSTPGQSATPGQQTVSRSNSASSGGDAGSASPVGGTPCAGGGSWPDQVRNMITANFGISNIGGYRPGDPGDHGKGLALDVMVPVSSGLGDSVANWALANKGRLNVSYVIWKQRINMGGGWRGMEDRGSITQNHYDHVHISLNPGSGSCS